MKALIEAEILDNIALNGIYSMRLSAPAIAGACKPGQFVNMYTGTGHMLLPRPISVCDADAVSGCIRLVYQIAGAGTELFSQMSAGYKIKLLGPLGNGFKIWDYKSHTLVAGGIGAPPLLFLTKSLLKSCPDSKITAFLGFRTRNNLVNEFIKLGVETHLATDDGSEGFKGNAVDLLRAVEASHDIIYACGPKPMLNAVSEYARKNRLPSQLSFEERMACGLGACVGCTVTFETDKGLVRKKVCSDGPVFIFNGDGHVVDAEVNS